MFRLPSLATPFSFAFTLKKWLMIGATLLLLGLTLYGSGFVIGHTKGKAAAEIAAAEKASKHLAEDAKKELGRRDALDTANKHNRELERVHGQELLALAQRFAAADAAARAADAATIASLRAGARSLRFRVASCSAGPAASGTAATGTAGEAYAELAPEVGGAVYAIASDGDAAIRQSNALNDYIDSALKLCNGQLPGERP